MNLVNIGHNIYRGKTTPIRITETDRLRHMYMIGKTGVGKSTIFQNMCLEDVENNRGVCFVDPHGESIDWLLSRIPKNRLEDVILFDPSNLDFPFGINLLEYNNEQEKDFLVSQVIEIFYKLFDPEKTGVIGPQFEHWLRNAALTVMSGEEGGSILEIPKLFVDKKFEQYKRKNLTDPIVQEFWSKQIAHTSDFHKSEMLNYFMSKFGHFLNNSLMRNILGQTKSSFNFDNVTSKEKIVLINLSKGKIGETNAQMLGLILMAKLQSSILKRAWTKSEDRTPFFLYIDEFQNLLSNTFISMLSESRKYGLAAHLTNQYFSQLPKSIQDAILGNTGTLLSFEVSAEDAELLSKEFSPFTKEDFLNLEKHNFYIKLMTDGKTSTAFSGVGLPPKSNTYPESSELIKKINNLVYGRPKVLTEAKINNALNLGV